MSICFTFPGQGSQKPGMGRELADAYAQSRQVFEEVDDALGEKLSTLIFEGPEEELTLTHNAQPALMAVSMAAIRAMESNGITVAGNAAFVAGHSLGEYSALAAAGTFTIADAARLLRTRGLAMQRAVPVGEGAMAAILGLDIDAVAAIAADAAGDEVCQTANDNAPGQVVVSGSKAAVERAAALAGERGAQRAIMLPVSAPFHCALMAPAAEVMAEALASVMVNAPAVPVVSNVLAGPISDPDEIRKRLVEQVTGTVRWRESVAWMAANGVDTLFEIGAGKVLTGLARRIDRSLAAKAVGTPDDISALLA
ncbi:MAG: ACP S-malonyltransferase [Rhodobiaceae bacterium]|nr:ACP S-malonyltransferase [Rhodobiaceae bacterium]MCC0053036.1 ACP S-malonyltransferase [Rhodobiaceae bacterium]